MDVVIEGLRFERADRSILSIPSLVFRHRRTTAVLGPNGAGKTTLLRLTAGLERAAAGRICIDGRDVGPKHRGNVSYVFQEHVFLRQSVRQNLALGLKLRGVSGGERRERILEAARLLGIDHLLDRNAGHLSGGERRRASIARSLCLRSSLMLLDEPLGGLDPATYARLLEELPRLVRASGATSIVVTHDYREALRLADDLVVLVEGRVRASGDKHAVFLRPTDPVVAELLGYAVLRLGGRSVAVRPDAIHPGAGSIAFTVEVEHVLDMVEHQVIVGSVDGVRLEVALPSGRIRPQRADRVLMHADRVCELPDG